MAPALRMTHANKEKQTSFFICRSLCVKDVAFSFAFTVRSTDEASAKQK